MPVPEHWVPSECLLPTPERPLRVAEFDDLFRFVLPATQVAVLDAIDARVRPK